MLSRAKNVREMTKRAQKPKWPRLQVKTALGSIQNCPPPNELKIITCELHLEAGDRDV